MDGILVGVRRLDDDRRAGLHRLRPTVVSVTPLGNRGAIAALTRVAETFGTSIDTLVID